MPSLSALRAPRVLSNPVYLAYLLILVVLSLYLLKPPDAASQLTSHDPITDTEQDFINNTFAVPENPLKAHRPDTTIHPIKLLHEEAKARFGQQMERQSKTLGDAIREYQRRYRRSPPPGFGEWFNFAVRHRSAIIDDFDIINESLAPFWKLEPRVVRQKIRDAATGPAVFTFMVHDGQIIIEDGDSMGEALSKILGSLTSTLPNLEILINAIDEPRILLTDVSDADEVVWQDLNRLPTWREASKPCRSRDARPSWHHPGSHVDNHGLPFVTDPFAARDICQNPQFQFDHGFFIAPDTFLFTRSPVPILSQGTPSTFSDILYPSTWYWNVIYDIEEFDVDWDDKAPTMYWSGSTTGGFSQPRYPSEPAWELHRHRFIRLTKQIGKVVHTFLTRRGDDEPWERYQSDEVLSRLYDTKFTRAVQCAEEYCDEMSEYYQLSAEEDGREGYRSRFLMDLDGNSFSGRFYEQIKSKSCPLKMTVFREWHDERLMPWVHYIPISVGMEELPETMRYLALTAEGDQIAREVAEAGREWYPRMLREVDAAIYLYRLFIEYARVTSDDRDA